MFGRSETIQRLIIKRQSDAQWDQEHLSPHFKQELGRKGSSCTHMGPPGFHLSIWGRHSLFLLPQSDENMNLHKNF